MSEIRRVWRVMRMEKLDVFAHSAEEALKVALGEYDENWLVLGEEIVMEITQEEVERSDRD